MIDGITIVNQYLYTNIAGGVRIIILAVILFVFTGGVLCWAAWSLFDNDEPGSGIVCGMFAVAVLVFAIWTIIGGVKLFNTHTTRYEVTIEDSVSFNDVMENYEIIDQNGQIWTIEVKEKEVRE